MEQCSYRKFLGICINGLQQGEVVGGMFGESVIGLLPSSRGTVLRPWTLSERGGRGDEQRGESVSISIYFTTNCC